MIHFIFNTTPKTRPSSHTHTQLMKLLAPIIGPEKTDKFFIDRIIALANHPVFYVRKCIVEYMPVFCQVMGQEFTETRLVCKMKKKNKKIIKIVFTHISFRARRSFHATLACAPIQSGPFAKWPSAP